MKWILALLLINAQASGSDKRTVQVRFDNLPKLVRERNLHAQGAATTLEAERIKRGHLTRSLLPRLSGEAGYESFKTGQESQTAQPYGSIEAKVNLFRGGRDRLQDRIQENRVRIKELESSGTYLEELTKSRRAYWLMISHRELLELLKAAIDQNEVHLKQAVQRSRAGMASDTDRLEFEMERTQLNQDLNRVSVESANSQRTLSVLLGFQDLIPIDAEKGVPHDHDDELLEAALISKTHRSVAIAESQRELLFDESAQAGRWWAPSLDVYGGQYLYTLRDRGFPDQNDRTDSVLGIRLTLELFDGFESKAASSSLKIEAEGAEKTAIQTSREIHAQFEGIKQELKMLHDLIHDAEKSIEQAKTYLTRTLSEYKRGVKNSPDVLNAAKRSIEFRRRYLELRLDYQLAKTELLQLLGK